MSEFATTGETESVTPTTFAEAAAAATTVPATPAPTVASTSGPKFVSASDLLKKTREAEKETRDRLTAARKVIIDDIVGDEANKERLMREMERSAERGYTKKVLRKFSYAPRKEGEEMPTHDEKGTQLVYEVEGRRYFLLSVLNKGGDRFFPELASRFGKGYWCGFYRDARDGLYNIFVSWGPQNKEKDQGQGKQRPSTGGQGRPEAKKAPSKSTPRKKE